jgi:hypothetical protein
MADGSSTEDEVVMASMMTDLYRSIYMERKQRILTSYWIWCRLSTKLTGEINDILLKLIDR